MLVSGCRNQTAATRLQKFTVKAAPGPSAALRLGPHPSHAERETADHRKAGILLHTIEALIVTLSDRPYGAIGDGFVIVRTAEAYYLATAAADHRDIEQR